MTRKIMRFSSAKPRLALQYEAKLLLRLLIRQIFETFHFNQYQLIKFKKANSFILSGFSWNIIRVNRTSIPPIKIWIFLNNWRVNWDTVRLNIESLNISVYLCLVEIFYKKQNNSTGMTSRDRKTPIPATTNDLNTNKLSEVVSSSSTADLLACPDSPKNSAECGIRDKLSVAIHKISQLKRS